MQSGNDCYKLEYVSFEQAIKLRNINFNWSTEAIYTKKGELNILQQYHGQRAYGFATNSGIIHNTPKQGWYYPDDTVASAPTLDLVFKWLRDDKQTHIIIDPINYNWKVLNLKSNKTLESVNNCASYEGAQLDALNKILGI